MGYEDDKTKVMGGPQPEDEMTKVIGRQQLEEEFPEEFSEFNRVAEESAPEAEVDELAYIEEDQARERAMRQAQFEHARQAQQPVKKKKSKKGLIIALIVLLLAAGAGAAYALFGMEKTQHLDVDLTKMMTEPDVSGYQGEAVLGEISVKADAVDQLTKDLESDEQKTAVAAFFDTVEYAVDKHDGLSEGDVVKISATYDQAAAEAADIAVTNTEYLYTVGKLKEKPEETKPSAITMPQWYRHISETEGELAITCLLIAEKGTSVTLPIEFMYCYAGGPMSEMVDTSQAPNLTYKGTGYYMEDGTEAPTGTVTEVDDSHIKYSVRQYGDKFTITINYTVNEDGSINVTSASGGEVQAPTGTYEAISTSTASNLGGE